MVSNTVAIAITEIRSVVDQTEGGDQMSVQELLSRAGRAQMEGNMAMCCALYRQAQELRAQNGAQPPVYSSTGEKHGRGSMPYRWVSGLTDRERELVREGFPVVIDRGVSTHAGNPPVRACIYTHDGRYDCRVPAPDRLAECLAVAGY
jgi:hypothetical protein